MDDIFNMIYVEGDILKSVCCMFMLVILFEFVLSIICIIKSAYKSVIK